MDSAMRCSRHGDGGFGWVWGKFLDVRSEGRIDGGRRSQWLIAVFVEIGSGAGLAHLTCL